MATLTEDRNTEYSLGDLLAIPVAADVRIFAGALVCTNVGGYAVPAANIAGLVFEGVATAQVDNRTRSDGDLSVVVRRRGRYAFDFNPDEEMSQNKMSLPVYAIDDHTIAARGRPSCVHVGRIAKLGAADGQCWVSIDGAVMSIQD